MAKSQEQLLHTPGLFGVYTSTLTYTDDKKNPSEQAALGGFNNGSMNIKQLTTGEAAVCVKFAAHCMEVEFSLLPYGEWGHSVQVIVIQYLLCALSNSEGVLAAILQQADQEQKQERVQEASSSSCRRRCCCH